MRSNPLPRSGFEAVGRVDPLTLGLVYPESCIQAALRSVHHPLGLLFLGHFKRCLEPLHLVDYLL